MATKAIDVKTAVTPRESLASEGVMLRVKGLSFSAGMEIVEGQSYKNGNSRVARVAGIEIVEWPESQVMLNYYVWVNVQGKDTIQGAQRSCIISKKI